MNQSTTKEEKHGVLELQKKGHIARFCQTSRKGEGTQQMSPFNSVSVSSTYFVQGMIQGHSAQLVDDTGAAFSLISHNFGQG